MDADILEIVILQHLRKIILSLESSKRVSKSVYTSTVVISPNPSSPTPSTSSAVKTCAPQSPGPAASLVQNEETPEKIGKDFGSPEATAKGDIL